MLVVATREVTIQEFVVVDGLSDDPTDKLEIAEMVGVAVGGGVREVGHTVPGGHLEQGVHGVENLPESQTQQKTK